MRYRAAYRLARVTTRRQLAMGTRTMDAEDNARYSADLGRPPHAAGPPDTARSTAYVTFWQSRATLQLTRETHRSDQWVRPGAAVSGRDVAQPLACAGKERVLRAGLVQQSLGLR